MKKYRQIMYTWSWQQTRVRLGFTTLGQTAESIRRLQKYVFVENTGGPEADRVWRCLNLMSATRMGIRGRMVLQGKTLELEQMEGMVADFRERLSEYYKRLRPTFEVPSEEQQLKELVEAFEKDRITFWMVQADLTKRFRRVKNSGDRPELKYYLDLMKKAQFFKEGTEEKSEQTKDLSHLCSERP